MSFQAYIDNIKTRTGKTPREFRELAEKKLLLEPGPWYFCYQCCFETALDPCTLLADPGYAGVEKEFAHVRACFFELHRQYTLGPVLFALAHERSRKERGATRSGIIGWVRNVVPRIFNWPT